MKILSLVHNHRDALQLEEQCRSILHGSVEAYERADTLESAATRLRTEPIDVLLLDPRLPGDDGLALLHRGLVRGAQTIVVADDPALAVRAFDCGALDFVPKPATRERLAKALLRVTPPRPPGPVERFIAVRRHGRIEFVPLDDLLYAEGSDKYSELVLANGRRSFYDKCLGRLEASLPPSFVRIHKSYLVRFPMVSRLLVKKGSRYYAELKNGERLPVGRSRYAQVKSRLL